MPCWMGWRFLDCRKNRGCFVPRLDELTFLKIDLGVVERIQDHRLHLLVSEAIGRLYLDLRLFTAAGFHSGDMQQSVRIDEELHFDTRQPRGHRRNTLEVETGKRAAIFRQFALSLQAVDRDIRLS